MDVLYVGYGTSNLNFSAFYKEGIKYLKTLMNEQKEQMTYYNHAVYEDSEVITLNGTFLTTKDNQPTTYFYTNKNYKLNKTRLFEFDHHLQRHTYGSYRKQVNYDTTRKSLLTYNLDYNQSGSINLFVKPTSKDKYKHRTILSFYSNQNCLIDLYIDERYQLKGVINGAFYDFTFKLNMDEWNMITFLFEPNQVWMSLNNSPLTRRGLFNLNLAGATLVVGSTLNVNEPENHFEGNFQMISIWSKLLDTDAIAKIYDFGLPITIQTKLDLNNRLKSKNIVYNNQVLTKKYQYYDDFYTENNEEKQHMKLLPTSELDIDGTETVYIYDEHSNVIRKEIINSLGKPELTIDYTYDELKRLSSETVSNVTIDESNPTNPSRTETVVEKFEYRYDQNGNIIEKKKYNHQTIEYVDIYYYDIAIKDRLEKIRRTTNNQTQDIFSLTYDTNTKFWPISFTDIKGQHTLQWQGTQLKSFGSYQYSYDEAGIRIKKSGAGTNVEYDLEGSKVVRSINHNEHKELNYHFDQHDQLVGFNYEGKEFIYQRNILGEIYGIIDLYGKQYVTYKYTAYGVPIPEEGTNLTTQEKTIATDLKRLNIYLYKGYIYDTETGLYYCQSRYYHPQIGRWLSIDSIDYLNPGAIGGLNLYAYCGNNPVMYIDRDGTSPQWWNPFSWNNEAKLIAGIIIIAGLAIATVSGGLISGAIGGLTSGSWEGFYDGFSTGFMTGAFIGGVTGAASNAFKVAKAAQSWAGTSQYSPYKDMVRHYNRHVLGEGQKHIAKNIVNYSRHANQFWSSTSSHAYRIGVDAFKIAGGPGGIFTGSGLIKSFWYITL